MTKLAEREALGGNGATKERLSKSKIQCAPRLLTRGGLVLSYGHYDTEHCALDYMMAKGFIEPNHYDAGYELRSIYYTYTITGRWIEEGGKGYDGDLMTHADEAQERFAKALRAVSKEHRSITRCVCVEQTHIPADYTLITNIKQGLEDLIKFFKNE